MKKLTLIALLGIILAACNDENNKASLNSTVIEKAKTTEDKPKEIEEEKINPEEEEKSEGDEKKDEIEELKSKYKHVRAKFIGVEEGDLIHHLFKSEKGKDFDFMIIQDNTYKLLVSSKSDEYSQAPNPKYKNKYFDIFYKVEKHDLLGWGTKEPCDVVKKLILVEE